MKLKRIVGLVQTIRWLKNLFEIVVANEHVNAGYI